MRLRPAHRVDGCAPGLEAGPFPVTRFCGATKSDLTAHHWPQSRGAHVKW